MTIINEDRPGEFSVQTRMRQYRSNGIWDGKDDVIGATGTAVGPKEKAIANMTEASQMMADRTEGRITILLRGDKTEEQFMGEFLKLPFIHARKVGTPPPDGVHGG